MLTSKNWKYRMALWVTIFFVLMLWVSVGKAQDRIKTFQMHKELTEDFVGCLYREDAIAIMKDLAKGDDTVGEKLRKEKRCLAVYGWRITYKEFVGSEIGKDGEHIAVYRGHVNGKDIYVPMIGWTHEVI